MSLRTLLLKIAALAVADALGIYVVSSLFVAGQWPVAVIVAVVTIGLNVLYLGPWAVPAKYLAPGVLLLITFQLFLVVYSGYVSFTNYGQGHLGSKQDAINALTVSGRERVPDSPAYRLSILDKKGALSFLVTDPEGMVSVGDPLTPLTAAPDAALDDSGKGVGLPGYRTLTFQDILARQTEVVEMAVPVSANVDDGVLRTPDGLNAYLYRPILVYSEPKDAMVNSVTGVIYADNGAGSFESADGAVLEPGWQAVVGLDNYLRVVQEATANGQLAGVFAWNVGFALLSVLMAFSLGTFLALVFNDPRLRGRRLYRALLILPFAFPVFLTIQIWAAMLNPQYGFINQVLLGGARIPWLLDPWLARFSVLAVSLWLEFPWWFLVATGALQSIPKELEEAAYIDGSGKWRLFRSVRLPLLLVTLAPLTISAFAFAFNNFNLIWLLNKGGPYSVESGLNAGATDILLTVTYKIAFFNPVKQYGLASALAIVIFMLVAAISIFSFRRTKQLEEIY